MILYYMIRSNNAFFGGRDEKIIQHCNRIQKFFRHFPATTMRILIENMFLTRQDQVFEKQAQAQYMSN